MKTVLLFGASGVFGRRLAEHLSGWPDIELIVTSRSKAKALDLAQDLARKRLKKHPQGSKIIGLGLNLDSHISGKLKSLAPWAVINCAGPFQGAGHSLAKDALSAKAHFIDIADAPDYLRTFHDGLDDLAKTKGSAAIAGASSTPALSDAVAKDLTAGWRRVDSIEIAIAPGGKSEVGLSVIQGVLSYCGRPITVWRNGEAGLVRGWGQGRYWKIPDLGRRRIAAVETIDPENLGPELDVAATVSFYAGLESHLEQFGLELLSYMRALGFFGSLQSLAPLLHRARGFTRRFNGDRGAMILAATGLDHEGRWIEGRWQLTASQDHGPYVPILPAAAALRALMDSDPTSGARLGPAFLSLDNIEAQMTPYAITTRREAFSLDKGLFRKALGDSSFDLLPKALRTFHGLAGQPVWSGRAEVRRGSGWVSRIIGKIMGLPNPGQNIAVTVAVQRGRVEDQENEPFEIWTRRFGDREFSSRLTCPGPGQFQEAFGPLSFTLDLTVDEGIITMPLAAWRFLGIPLPRALGPRSISSEQEDNEGRFVFDVRLELPFLGLLAHYRGWLVPKGTPSTTSLPKITPQFTPPPRVPR
ncbi:MAG: DUF4166 domain-containing protein [Pseudomonadota bacterium]